MPDDETDLYYNWHRYYAPRLGRYAQSDPIGFGGGANPYGYGLANPLSYSDPEGRLPILLAAWGAYEIGSAIWDAWNAAKVLFDDCASRDTKLLVAGGFLFSAIAPGGGYGSAVKALRGSAIPKVAEAAARGRLMHDLYDPGPTYFLAFRLPSGRRVDAVDFENRIIRELKPNNPRAISRGYKQLEAYKDELTSIHGVGWTTVLDVY